MKKLNVLSAAFLLGMFSTVGFAASTQIESNNIIVVEQEVSKTTVEVTDLPEAVTEAIQTQLNQGWEINEAALIADKEKTLYIIKLSKEDETSTLKITPEGEIQ